MRERIKQDRQEVKTSPNWYTVGSSYIIGPAPVSYVSSKVFEAMQDVVTPKYKELERNGNIVNNPMYKVLMKSSATPTLIDGEGICSGKRHKYQLSDVPIVAGAFNPDLWVQQIENVLSGFSDESEITQAKAWSDIDVSEIQGAASLGELPETVDWLVDRIRELAKLLRAIKRKDVKRLKELVQSAKKQDSYLNAWLEYRYAIRPLVSDIIAALKALNSSLEKGQRFTARGAYLKTTGPTKTAVKRAYTNPALAANFLGYYADETKQTTLLCRAGVLVEIDHSINAGMALWGLDSPLEAIWELITLSFVVDWIINIGDVLSALIMNPGLTPKASWITMTYKTVIDIRVTGNWHDNPGCSQNIVAQFHSAQGSAYEELFLSRRIPTTKRFLLPHLNVRISPDKILDIYAIAKNLLR